MPDATTTDPTVAPTVAPAADPAADRLAVLRREVGLFRAGERRRRFPAALHLGELGGTRLSMVLPASLSDPALAFDLVDTLPTPDVARARDVWLTRPGVPELHDQDLLWLTAADGVLGARGVRLRSFHAVTRTGWLDVRTGERRTWKRLRLRD